MVSKYSQFVQLTAVVSVFPFQDLKHGIFFSMKLNSASLNSLKISLKNASHKIAHADCAKFLLMVSLPCLSCHKYREILLSVSYLFFFNSKDIDPCSQSAY